MLHRGGIWAGIAAASLAAVAGGVLAVAVVAHTTHSPSSLGMNAYTNDTTNNYVWGAVTSANSHCLGDRKVRVYRKTPGSDNKLGADVSQENAGVGTYTVTAPNGDLHEGTYYSQIHKHDLRPGPRHAHICGGARSSDVGVGP